MLPRWCALSILSATLVLAGCSNGPKPAPTPTQFPPLEGAQTLPPTWTPTASWTPAPTHTPTLIPIAAATLSAEDICATFKLIVSPLPAARVDYGGAAVVALQKAPLHNPPPNPIAPRPS